MRNRADLVSSQLTEDLNLIILKDKEILKREQIFSTPLITFISKLPSQSKETIELGDESEYIDWQIIKYFYQSQISNFIEEGFLDELNQIKYQSKFVPFIYTFANVDDFLEHMVYTKVQLKDPLTNQGHLQKEQSLKIGKCKYNSISWRFKSKIKYASNNNENSKNHLNIPSINRRVLSILCEITQRKSIHVSDQMLFILSEIKFYCYGDQYRLLIFFKPFLAFVYQQSLKEQNRKISSLARYTFMKVIHTKEGVSRFNLPTILEINSVMQCQKINIPIYFFNGKVSIVPCESHTTIGDILDYLFNQSKISQDIQHLFGLIEINDEKEDVFGNVKYLQIQLEMRYLEICLRICDILSQCQGKQEQLKQPKLYFSIRAFIIHQLSMHTDYIIYSFYQIAYQFNQNLYKMPYGEYIQFAAIKQIVLKDKIHIPTYISKIRDQAQILNDISALQEKLSKQELFILCETGLQIIKTCFNAQATMFPVSISLINPNPLKLELPIGQVLIIAFKPSGIYFLDYHTYVTIQYFYLFESPLRDSLGNYKSISYSSIISWGCGKENFVIGTEDGSQIYSCSTAIIQMDYTMTIYSAFFNQMSKNFDQIKEQFIENIDETLLAHAYSNRIFSSFKKVIQK